MVDSEDSTKPSNGFVILGIIIAILGVMTVISSTYSQYQDARQDREAVADRDCFRDQLVEIAEALEARTDPATQRDDALKAWAKAVTQSRAAGKKALPKYLTKQKDFENTKNYNEFPDGVCE